MPQLSCRSCGRQIYTVTPLESLFAEERRCPRCGAFLNNDRRAQERRLTHRRVNPPDDPGPPRPTAKVKAKGKGKDKAETADDAVVVEEAAVADGGERRVARRRTTQRRGGATPPPAGANDSGGWRD